MLNDALALELGLDPAWLRITSGALLLAFILLQKLIAARAASIAISPYSPAPSSAARNAASTVPE
mgnify:CR=1 FL=1